MGRIKILLLVLLSCCFGLIGAMNLMHSLGLNVNTLELAKRDDVFIVPNATISGGATVCQNDGSNPQITFTGSGGDAPYTFTYNINGGEIQTVVTLETSNSVSITADITDAGTFNYNLITVEDSANNIENATGSVQIVVIPSPDASLGGTGAGSTFNGIPVFRHCENSPFEFNFTNITSTTSINSNYNISWGDGSPDFNQSNWSSITHSYDVGIYNLVYTIEGNNGCNTVKTYTVFVGSNPAVSLGNPGNTDICNTSSLTFPITGTENNPPGTIYTVTFNDGSLPQIFNHPPPASVTHTFTSSSCNTSSSDGTNNYLNSFSANIVAANPCSTSSVGVVPIYVSTAPEAGFDSPEVACTTTQVCLENTSFGEENKGAGSSCDDSPNIIWNISPTSGYSISSGILGNDFGSSDPNLWASGSDDLCLNFTESGTYTVTLTTANRCGIDTVVKTICVEEDLDPIFSVDNSEGCSSVIVNTINSTDESNSCVSATYFWDVVYTPGLCGAVPSWEFLNGTDESSLSPMFSFNSPGFYEINMTATNTCGDFTTSKTIEVKQPPSVTIDSIADACGNMSINPIANVNTCASSSDSVSYSWSFPGGSPSTSDELNPGTVTFENVGDYIISFSVTNSCGTTTTTETFSINNSSSIINTDLTQTICSGATSSEINIVADNSNATFSWQSNNPAGLTGYVPNGTTSNIPSQTLINTTNGPVTLVYTVTTEVDGCLGSPVNFEIIVEPAPLITTQPISDSVCVNGSINDLLVEIDGTGTANYQWYVNTTDNNTTGTVIDGATSATFTPPVDVVGINYYYVVISFSTGGCSEIVSETAKIEIAEIAQIDEQPNVTQSICVGGEAQELSVELSGGAGTANYQWFENTNNSNTGGTVISGATQATYTPPLFTNTGTFYYYVEISYSSSGCSGLVSAVSEIEVVADPIIDVQPVGYQNLCQNTIPEDLIVSISGGIGAISYQWYQNTINNNTMGTAISGATSETFTPPVSDVGTLYYYCVISQDTSGCEVISAISEVEVSAGAQFTSQPASDELCLGESTSDLMVEYSNGTGTPEYQWFQNSVDDTTTGVPISGANSASFSPNVSEVGVMYYYVIITFNSGGCSQIISNTAEITISETPNISDSSILICSGNSFEYAPDSASGDIVPLNTLYTWSTPLISPIGSINGASEQATPIESISQFLENTTINPSTVTYTVTPISGDCVGEDFEVVVVVNPSISVNNSILNNLCYQSNTASIEIEIVGGVPFGIGNPYTITWTGPNGFSSSDEDIFNLEAGVYTLEVEDNGGCPYMETFIISEPEDLSFSNVDFDPETISCYGANNGSIGVEVEGGTLPYNYSWTLNGLPFSNEEDLSNLGPGTYSVSVSDANNCGPITQNFELVEPPLLEVTLDLKTDVLCYGDATGNIFVNVIGGRLDYAFSWTGPNGFTSSDQNLNSLFAGTYNLTVTDSSGCTDTLEVEIVENEEIDIDITVTEIKCYGDNDASIIINNISGGVPPYDVSWSNFGSGNSQFNLSAGTYIITITDAENCEREFSIVVDEAPIFLIDPVVTQMSCSGENDASINLNFVGGIDPVTLVWDDDPTAGTERNNLAPGTYSVTITDGTPCVLQDSFTIFDILPLELSANVTDALDCEDTNSGALNLLIQGGTPPFNVVWSNGATTEDLENIPPNNYVAQVTDANGCVIEGSWTVNRFDPLVLDVDTRTDVNCETHTLSQSFVAMASGGVPPYQFNWSSGSVSGSNNQFMSTEENGMVVLEVTDSQFCTASYSVNVDTPVLGDPDFTISSLGLVNYGIFAIQDPITFTNTATGDYLSVLWDFGDGSFSAEENPVHTFVSTGNYVVTQTVTYPYGCVYQQIVTLIIEEGYKLIMPDAFTPNNDGLNDFFGPVYIGLNSLEINIYDTWGSLIYSESGDNIRGWDGKVKEEEAENGNYYYTFTAKTFYGDIIKKQGAFVFIK